jgi:hypothetical protein
MYRAIGICLLGLVAVGFISAGETLDATGAASGDIVLGFNPLSVSAQIAARIEISGCIKRDGDALVFTVEGEATGSGRGSLADLSVAAWIAIDAQGTTETGEIVHVRGGIEITQLDGILADTAQGSGLGRFYLLFDIAGTNWVTNGSADGLASGQFVVPDDPSTMQAQGDASFSFEGTARVSSDAIVSSCEGDSFLAPPEDWSQDLLNLFGLAGVTSAESAPED